MKKRTFFFLNFIIVTTSYFFNHYHVTITTVTIRDVIYCLCTGIMKSTCSTKLGVTSIPKKFVPNKSGYVGMTVVWLTVPTLLLKSFSMAMLTDRQ